MKKTVAIEGPTASGKSALALALCEKYSGELVSFDSMQVYRKMDVGTAKPDSAEQARVPHHMIDILEPDEKFSAADFIALASRAVDDINSRGKTAFLCGGTGLYLDSFLSSRDYGEIAPDEELRRSLFDFAEKNGAHALHEMLRSLDGYAADAIHENNIKRVVRAIEICKTSGMTKTEWDAKAESAAPKKDADVIILDFHDRDVLYRRIDSRVDKMMGMGLVDETRFLYLSGFLRDEYTAAQAIGYKEILPYIKGESSLDDAALALKLATRHLAKRQLTWFRKKDGIRLFVDEYATENELFLAACDALGGGV
ncbi:MAG: tRNA (adenosine(37)-N6)-dimethylallyltransferase MiaA [Clostridiales bacterium]|nr:tRNA (adenosine(37)-N6)-dimethylallyltransferase MiaA [Clostridiales bacterium]